MLTFDTAGTSVLLQVPEHLMADITGQFIRERLFGLH
jgi:hypothetical protein